MDGRPRPDRGGRRGQHKPSKRRSAEKIDGIVALVMAVKRWQAHLDPTPSVYEERGMIEV